MVSSKDYFLAKRFDLDQDGRLSPSERQSALDALRSGFEDRFIWGLDKTGVLRGMRIQQIRGRFIDGYGDFGSSPPSLRQIEKRTGTRRFLGEIAAGGERRLPRGKFVRSEFLVGAPRYHIRYQGRQTHVNQTGSR